MRFRRIGDATVAATGSAVGIAVRKHDDEEDAGRGREEAARRAYRAAAAREARGSKGVFIRAARPHGTVERSALLRALVNIVGDEVFGNGQQVVVIDFRPLPAAPTQEKGKGGQRGA